MRGVVGLSLLVPAVMGLGACGRGEARRGAIDAGLRSDLERAAAPTADLAASQFRPRRTVSAMELDEAGGGAGMAIHARAIAPRVRPSRRPVVAPVAALAPEPAPQPTLVASTAAPEPVVPAPRAAPAPIAGAGYTEGAGSGGVGGPVGVIIRGGHIGDDDHCEIHPGQGRIPVAVNQRIPIRPAFGGRGIW